MLFNSLEFMLFLPIVFILYWFVFERNLKIQNLFIVVVSYIFYGWWNVMFLLLIAFTTLCSYISGILIEKSSDRRKAKIINTLNILLNISILGVYKYYDFFVNSFIEAFSGIGINMQGSLLHLILPVGISFYTFQALSYSIDVYKKKISATKDIVSFFAYVSFFPQLIAGPIERATNLLPQFQKRREFDYCQAVDGMRLILWGFFKKIVIADTCAGKVDLIFQNHETLPSSSLWLGAILFTFQIYGDFSGYSDIAIGVAKLFGINLMKNFNFPYFSRDIAEFWRRWHISLSTWFRDYIYIPLGGSRNGKWNGLRNTLIIFTVSGLWHGANWTYVVWGLYHGLLFIPLLLLNLNRKHTGNIVENRLLPSFKEAFSIFTTFILVVIGWVIFRAESIETAYTYIKGMFGSSILSYPREALGIDTIIYPLIVLFIIIEWVQRNKEHALCIDIIQFKYLRTAVYLFILIVISFFIIGTHAEFIYFQF